MKETKREKQKRLKKECDKLLKEFVLQRDKVCQRFPCPYCNNKEGTKCKLQVHHIIPKNKCAALIYNPQNIVLLCEASHKFWAESINPYHQKDVIIFYRMIADFDYLCRVYERYSKDKNVPITKRGKARYVANYEKIRKILKNE